MFIGSRNGFSGKGPEHVLLEKRCKLKPNMNFCACWNQFGISLNQGEKCLKKNSFIRTGISRNQGDKRLKEGIHNHVQNFLLKKIRSNFNRGLVRHLCLFPTHNIWDSVNSGWKWYSHVNLGNQSRSMRFSATMANLFCGHHWREACLTHKHFVKV